MEKKSDILSRIDRQTGMTVPEGYFADFAKRMADSLPDAGLSVSTMEPKRSFWNRVRPYAYMAAMFAGIWCMLKMFTMMGGGSADLSIDNYPGVVTALSDDHFVKEYVWPTVDDYDILEDIYLQDDITPEEFFDFDEDGASLDADSFILPAPADSL